MEEEVGNSSNLVLQEKGLDHESRGVGGNTGSGAVSAVFGTNLLEVDRGCGWVRGLGETVPVETTCAVEEFEVERGYGLAVYFTIGGDLHRHD